MPPYFLRAVPGNDVLRIRFFFFFLLLWVVDRIALCNRFVSGKLVANH